MLGLQPVELGLGNGLPGINLLDQAETICGVATARCRLFSRLRELLQCVLAHRLQHAESPFPVGLECRLEETLVDERVNALEDGGGTVLPTTRCNPLRSVECEAAYEDRELAEQRLPGRVEQVVAPGDRLSHRLQARRRI